MRGIIFCKDLDKGNAELLNVMERYKLMQISTQVKIEKDYHLISSRRRGLYREFSSGY